MEKSDGEFMDRRGSIAKVEVRAVWDGKVYDCERVVASRGNGVADVKLQVGKTHCLIQGTGEFELTVGRRKAYAVVVDGWKIVSGAEIEAGELVTNVVDH